MLLKNGHWFAIYLSRVEEVYMLSTQKVSNIYKSNYIQEVQPTRRLDKYDSSSQSHHEKAPQKDFKSILQRELEKQNSKKKKAA